jgi:poly(3-hydroxybutyrate) depolymerase
MKRVAVLLVVLLAVTCPGHASQKSEGKDPGKIVKQSIRSQGRNRTFYLFVPENISAAQPAPLIVLLHGSGRNGLSLVEKWKDIAAKEGIVLAGPDSTNSNTWSSKDDGPDFLRDLVESFKSKYPINSRRIYLFGHSAGAVYSLTLSMIESEYFAATAVHAGAWRDQGRIRRNRCGHAQDSARNLGRRQRSVFPTSGRPKHAGCASREGVSHRSYRDAGSRSLVLRLGSENKPERVGIS